MITNSFFISIFMAVTLGFALGLEREITNKNAGLRTHIFVCLGSCVFTILSVHGFPTFVDGDNFNPNANGVRDTARIAAQILTGIGFIGAGTVLRHGSSVHGLTTAATLWMAASIGMACGCQKYDIAIFTTIVSILTLILVKFFERKILIRKKVMNKRLRLSLTCNSDCVDNIQKHISEKFRFLSEIKRVNTTEENLTKIVVVLNLIDNNPIHALYKEFNDVDGITAISIRESEE